SEMEQSLADGITYFRRGVVVRYRTMELVANQVALSESTGQIIADGNVRLKNDGQYWVGEHLEYNYKAATISGENFRTGFPPFFAGGLRLDADLNGQIYSAENSFFTTDDIGQPKFRVRAKRFRITNGDTIEAKNATVVVGDTPVMVLPYYKRVLQKHSAYWRMTPGYRSYFGPYLLTSYHFPITTNILGGVKLDLYQRRGVGLGPDFSWNLPKWGEGNFEYYDIKDQDPRTDPFDQPIQEDRHRVSFSHRVTLRTNLTAKVVVREQSDPWMIRDFFETEYRKNSQPRSFLEVNQHWSNWSLDLLAQPQLNEFYQTVERLPDLKLSGLRQQIGESPLYYESESSVGYFKYEPGDPEFRPLRGVFGATELTEYAAMRADSYHQILWPQTYFGWLNFVPRVGGRFTQYSETEREGTTFDERSRFVFNTGAETSMKASRVWRGVRSKFWEVNELRHILEPSVNYVFVPNPNYSPNELPQFDREIPSLRLLPIEYPDYNAIDSIDSQNVFRLALRNKLQTKREEGIQNLVNWALYTDWRLNPPEGQTTFSDIYSDLDLRPRSWLALGSETRFDVKTREWNAAYHTATISPNSTWSLRLGHRYFRGGPEFGPDSDNNTVFSSLFLKMNENWAARLTHHFEGRDGTLEEQYYTIYRDFRNWTGALTFRVRDNRSRSDDFAVALTFQLKAFPRFRLGDDANEHSFLLGS
ncbi:MAG TPA: LPS assembly protein LptD, partial [Verrucomicrobiae bacterium]|nr:LPS assembly protein LptD [Verrucomicrobiae bacterium]